jgi:hypothetical protein
MRYCSSVGDVAEVVLLLERAKLAFLKMAEEV